MANTQEFIDFENLLDDKKMTNGLEHVNIENFG